MALKPQVAPELLNKVTKALGVTQLDQWYYVSHYAITRAIGTRVLRNYGGSVVSFLKAAYPNHHFDEDKLASTRKLEKDQKFIEVVIRKLFPNTEIHTKARKAVGIVNPETESYLEIDFWIPSLKLGIEYQDKHHFSYQWYANETLEKYQKRDDIKKSTMSTLGYTLITIGYWWDKTLESVVATIRKFRPDLLLEFVDVSAAPIPSDPPVAAPSIIPGVAGVMSPVVLKDITKFDPTNWYAGEKHDGIRGVYSPKEHKIFSRAGNELSVHPSLLKDIPDVLVEGEIVAGRGNYNNTIPISYHTHHDKVNWSIFRYILYDTPDSKWENYTERYSVISRELLNSFIFAQLAFRLLLANQADLKVIVDAILSDTGEGVIVQKDARYEYGRSESLVKIKVRRDADAQVLSVNKNSCTCKLVSGVTAEIIFSADFNPSNLKARDIISYYHNGYAANGMPRKAEIYKLRYDLNWENHMSSEDQKLVKKRSITEALGNRFRNTLRPAKNKIGHWNKSNNVRAFFDEFARTAGFDPLVPVNWYPVRQSALLNAKGGGLLSAYGSNVQKALLYAYPELKFDKEMLRTRASSGRWSKSPNVRAFFDEFALTAGFDPLAPDNWYSISTRAVHQAGGDGILNAFGNNVKKALSCAYPELKLDEKKFRTSAKLKGKSKTKVNKAKLRGFFDEFARTYGFDPLVAENWYTVRHSCLLNAQGSSAFLTQGSNLKRALAYAYPELKFDKTKLKTNVSKGHWQKSLNVRAFFDDFANTSGFDSLVPENWYPVRTKTVHHSGGIGLLTAYGYNLKNALLCAYPELKFDVEKFRSYKTGKT